MIGVLTAVPHLGSLIVVGGTVPGAPLQLPINAVRNRVDALRPVGRLLGQ